MGLKPKTSAIETLATDNDDRLTRVCVRPVFHVLYSVVLVYLRIQGNPSKML